MFDQRGELPLLPFGNPIGPSTLLRMVSLSNHFVLALRGGVYIKSTHYQNSSIMTDKIPTDHETPGSPIQRSVVAIIGSLLAILPILWVLEVHALLGLDCSPNNCWQRYWGSP